MVGKARQTVAEMAADKANAGEEWVPASTLDQIDGLDRENFVYRWVDKRPQRVKKFLAEGWSFVNELEGDRVLHRRAATGALDAGGPLTSEVDFREVVMMKLPVSRAEARRRYYQRKTDSAMQQIGTDAKQQAQALGGDIAVDAKVQTGDNPVTVIE
jgi:hypothetical protein